MSQVTLIGLIIYAVLEPVKRPRHARSRTDIYVQAIINAVRNT